MKRLRFDVDEALDCIDLTFPNYTPSVEAFEFFNLVKLVMGKDFEISSPKFHYFMVDMLYGNLQAYQFPYTEEMNKNIRINPRQIGILAARGLAKSTITTLFYPIVASIRGALPTTGPLSHIMMLSDSQQGGAKSQARLLSNTLERSVFAQNWFESMRFTDTEAELVRKGNGPIEKRHMLLSFRGAQALSLDSTLYTETETTTIGEVEVGDYIYGPDGHLTKVIEKSKIFHKPMYRITLVDGRAIKVSDDHINSILIREGGTYEAIDITTKSLIGRELKDSDGLYRIFIENTKPVRYPKTPLGRMFLSSLNLYDYIRALGGSAWNDGGLQYVIKGEATKDLPDGIQPNKVAIASVVRIEDEPSQCIAVNNKSRQFLTNSYTRTHNTGGIRSGSRNPVTGERIGLLIADDVIKNEAEAYSETIMNNVSTALVSDAKNAMRAKNTQFVLINTPFHKRDPIYTMIEGGGFTPLVIPICREIRPDLTKEEFVGAWSDYHDYNSVIERYLDAVDSHKTRNFNQELMLRVSNEEDRLVHDDLIQWYDRNLILKMLDGYSLYITTDFTTTGSASSDFSGAALWAVSSNYDYFLIDLVLRKQELEQQYNEIFRMVATWSKGSRPIEVGVEIDGQQKAHLFALKQKMMMTNRYFSFARQKGAPTSREGISSGSRGNKLDRFRYVVPLFQNRKIWFPEQLKDTAEMKEAIKQLRGATLTGFTYADDFNDIVSQLGLIDIYPGSGDLSSESEEVGVRDEPDYWLDHVDENEFSENKINVIF